MSTVDRFNTACYPEARVGDEVESRVGLTFPDPYRWLEHDDEDSLRWQQRQAEVAAAYTRKWPGLDELHAAGRSRRLPHGSRAGGGLGAPALARHLASEHPNPAVVIVGEPTQRASAGSSPRTPGSTSARSPAVRR